MLAGQEHGRTIPLAEVRRWRQKVSSQRRARPVSDHAISTHYCLQRQIAETDVSIVHNRAFTRKTVHDTEKA
jgi:hypothetical protein